MSNNIYSLFSSSSGNSTLVTDGETNILVDAGSSLSAIERALGNINTEACEIDAIVVTHEHSDHIKGIKPLAEKYNIPVYANEKTAGEIVRLCRDFEKSHIRLISPGEPFTVRGMEVTAFSTPHDSADSMGYTFLSQRGYMSVATDMGHITKQVLGALSKSEAVLIESNHDVTMLENGRYPYFLKKRILSDKGHLSNEKCAWLATQLAIWGTKRIILGHLSEQNNTPELALDTTCNMLRQNGFEPGGDVLVKVAGKNYITHI